MKDYMEDMSLRAIENESLDGESQGKSRVKKHRIKIKRKKKDSSMTRFFQQVDIIQTNIEHLGKATAEVNQLCDQFIHATSTEEENTTSGQLKLVVDKTNKLAKNTKDLMCSLEQDKMTLKAKGKLKSNVERIRANLFNTLNRKYCDEIQRYQAAQQAYKKETMRKIKRQVQYVKPNVTDDEVQTILRSEGGREALYRELVLEGRVSAEVKTTYNKVTERYQDVLNLESSVADLHQMFLDVALLTEQQGEILDEIEFHVTSAADHVEEGNVHVHKALRYLKKIQKKRMLIGLIIIVVVGILIMVILAF